VVRGLSLPHTAYTANCPRLIVAPSPVAILGKGFVIAFFDERLVVALLNGCGHLGVFAIPALGVVHTVFGALNLLAFGDVHAVFGILAVLNLSILALLVVM
jgi:hypothetical protein